MILILFIIQRDLRAAGRNMLLLHCNILRAFAVSAMHELHDNVNSAVKIV